MTALDSVITDDGYTLAGWTVGPAPHGIVFPNGAAYGVGMPGTWSARGAIVYDLRNRGASQTIDDPGVLGVGIGNDLRDLDAVRRAAGLERIDLVAHSYVAEVALRFAATHPTRVRRVVAIAPTGYAVGHAGPPSPDAVAVDVFARIAEFMRTPAGDTDVARCEAAWEILAPLYVADARLAPRIRPWGRCDLANERVFLRYWLRHVEPSLRATPVADAALGGITCPVLVIHGDRDRSAPYAAGRAWAERLPNARLLTVAGAAHASWIEAPELVVPAIDEFLAGDWPGTAERVAPRSANSTP